MRKKYLGIVCIIYSLLILYCILFNKLNNYLAPTMQLYIKLSFIPLLIIGIVLIITKPTTNKFKISDLILLLPIILLVISGDGRLSLSLATNKSINNKKVINKSTNNKSQVKESYSKPSEQYDFTNPTFKIEDYSYSELSGYITFSPKAEKYIGSTIKVKGFAIKDNEVAPEGYYALGKYVVSCCTADASFSGFVVKDDSNTIRNDRWYDIEGVLEQGVDKTESSILYINVINIKEINSKTETQYVYPCYAYGNKKCEEINKYDLN